MLLRMESVEFGHLKHFGQYPDDFRFDCYADPHDLDPEGIGPDGEDQATDRITKAADFLDDTFEEWSRPDEDDAEATGAALAFFNDVKSDCMWGSNLFGVGRKRDVSLTLADLFDSQPGHLGGQEGQDGGLTDLLGTSPPDLESQIFFGGCGGLMDSSQAEEEESETKRPAIVKKVSKLVNGNLPHIEPGRSLLLSSNRSLDKRPSPNPLSHQTFIDHSYFSQTPAKSRTPRGLLTPNETSSSEDDEMFVQTQSTKPAATQGIDKRKIVQAVQSLIKKSPNAKPHTVKFRFRMKFKPSDSVSTPFPQNTDASNSNKHNRRKSALLNPHCPTPLKQSSINFKTPKNVKSDSRLADSRLEANVLRSSKTGTELQKIRDHRDLHNSMERQRRIDLRFNFDLLKSAIPDLAIKDKASKLNIFKQATVYCRKLAEQDAQLRQSANAERARNASLRKKFQLLESQCRVRRPSARPLKPRRL